MECLYDFVKDRFQLLNQEELACFLEGVKIEHLKKSSVLIETGEVQTDLPILISGVLRGYLLDIDGQDITDSFMFQPGELAMNCHGIGEISPVTIESVTDCRIARIPMERILDYLEKSPAMFKAIIDTLCWFCIGIGKAKCCCTDAQPWSGIAGFWRIIRD